MSEAYTRLGIQIEVGKDVQVDSVNVVSAVNSVLGKAQEAASKHNVFGHMQSNVDGLGKAILALPLDTLMKSIKSVTDALNGMDMSKLSKGITANVSTAKKDIDSMVTTVAGLRQELNKGFELKVKKSEGSSITQQVKADLEQAKRVLDNYKNSLNSPIEKVKRTAYGSLVQMPREFASPSSAHSASPDWYGKLLSIMKGTYPGAFSHNGSFSLQGATKDSGMSISTAQDVMQKLSSLTRGSISNTGPQTGLNSVIGAEVFGDKNGNFSKGKFDAFLVKLVRQAELTAKEELVKGLERQMRVSHAGPDLGRFGGVLQSALSRQVITQVPALKQTSPATQVQPNYTNYASVPNTAATGITAAATAVAEEAKKAKAAIDKEKAEVQALVKSIATLEKMNADLAKQLEAAVTGTLKLAPASVISKAAKYLGMPAKELKALLTKYSEDAAAQKAVLQEFKGFRGAFNNPNAKVQELQDKESAAKIRVTERNANLERQNEIEKTRKTMYQASEERKASIEKIKQLERQATLERQNDVDTVRRAEKKAEMERAEALRQQQIAWNQQAGTRGLEYKANPYGAGFVRSSVDTSLLDAQKQMNDVRPSISAPMDRYRITDIVQAEDLARIRQAHLAVAELTRQNQNSRVTAKDAADAFARMGVNLADIKDNGEAVKIANGLKRINIAADTTTNSFKDIAKEVKQVSMWSKLFGESLGKMATRLTEFYSLRTAILAVGSQLRDAVSGAVDFNQNIRDIAAIAGSSREEMGALGASILDIAKNSRFSANEVAGLMQVLAQAGIKARDLGEVSSVVGKFATATASKPEVAADVFTTTLTVFKKEASESTTIANALTAALNNSKLTTEGLATAFNYLAPQAAQFGMTMEQTLGVVAGMSQAGVKASTIGTGTSQLLKELAVPKERLKNLLDYYGIKTEEVNPKLKTFAEIVETLNSAVGRSGEKGVQAEHLFAALESRVGRSVVTAVTLGADTFTNMTNSITGTNAATVAFEKTMEGPRAKINVLKQEVLSLAVSIGGTLGPALAGMTDFITSAVRGLSTTPGLFTSTALGIGAITVAVRALTIAAMANPIIAGITVGVVAITAAMAYFGKETDETIIKSREQHKAYVEMAESTQRVKDVTSSAIVEAERNNKSLKEYTELLKGNTAQVDKANLLGGTYVELKGETKKSLYALKDSHKDWFKNLDIESLKLGDLHNILKLVNEERAKGTHASVSSYNEIQTKINELEPKLAADKAKSVAYSQPGQPRTSLTEYFNDAWARDYGNPNSLARREKGLAKLQAERQTKLADTQPDVLTSAYKKDPTTNLFVQKTKADKDKDAAALAALEKKRAVSRIQKPGGTSSAEKSYSSSIIGQLQEKSKELQAEIKLQEEIFKDADKSYEERADAYNEAAIALSKSLEFDTNAEVIKLTSEYASKNKIKGYDPNAQLAALEKGQKYEMEAGNEKSFAAFSERVTKMVDRKTKEYEVSQGKLTKEFTAIDKKYSEEYETFIVKYRDESLKQQAAEEKKIMEYAFLQSGSDYTAAAEKYHAYLLAEEIKITNKYNKARSELAKKWATDSRPDADQRYNKSLGDINVAEKSEITAKRTDTASGVSSKIESRAVKDEKAADVTLGTVQKQLELQKSLVWTGVEVEAIELKILEASIKNTEEKIRINQVAVAGEEALKLEMADKKHVTLEQLDLLASTNKLTSDEYIQYTNIVTKLEQYNEKLQAGLLTKQAYDAQKTKASDDSFFGNFSQGIQKATQSMGTFKSMTQELGTSVTNSVTNGISDSLYGMVNALSAGENAWSSFKNAIGNMLKSIGEMLMKYVLQMLVVYAVQKLIGFAMGAAGGESGTITQGSGTVGSSLMTNGSFLQVQPSANGGIIQSFAGGSMVKSLKDLGGFIPTNMGTPGKDSVPAMLMPGEVVIKKSSVDKYGTDYLLALNEGKISKFAEGGSVGSSSPASPARGDDKQQGATPYSFSIINVADVNSIPPIDGQAVVNIVSFDAAKKGSTYHTIRGIMQG